MFGSIGGIIAAGHTAQPAFLLLGEIGTMRMLLELLFKMVVPSYAPGKFRSMVGPYVERHAYADAARRARPGPMAVPIRAAAVDRPGHDRRQLGGGSSAVLRHDHR